MRRAALLYAALAIALSWPLALHPATAVLSEAPDTNLTLWILAWDTHALTHQPLSIFDANIYYPARHTLAYSENLIGSAFLAAPVVWLTGNLVLAMNLVAVLSSVLCGAGTYLLARKVGLREPGALIAGLIFAFSPPRFLRLDQLHLATIQWVPFALAYLHAYFDEGRPRDLRRFLGFFTIQALTSGHGAVFLLLAASILIASRVALGEPVLPARRVRDVGVAGALAVLPAMLVMIPYRQAQLDAGLRRTLENWTVTPESFLASPSQLHRAMLGLLHAGRFNDAADAYLFPGFVPLGLAAAGLVASLARLAVHEPPPDALAHQRNAALVYVLVVLACVLLAIGPPLGLWPRVYWLPGFNFIRVPSRFMMLAVLGVAVLAGIGIDRLASREAWKRAVLTALAGALLVAEFATVPFELTAKALNIPPIDRWVATLPDVRAIAEVPLVEATHITASEMRHTAYMLHSTAHWRKTVEGYSGIRPPASEQLYTALLGFPDEASLRSLTGAGVSHVVVHADLYERDEWPAVERRLQVFGAWLHLEQTIGGGRLYSLHQPSTAARRE